jgi:hypothetical protein
VDEEGDENENGEVVEDVGQGGPEQEEEEEEEE